MQQVPNWWIWFSGIYFILSFIWSVGLCIAVIVLYKKAMPLITESQVQIRRVSNQARSVATKAAQTADIVHAQTQHLLGNAETASVQVTKQARTVGAALTGMLIAARVVNFVRKII